MQRYDGFVLRKIDDPTQGNVAEGVSVQVRNKSDNSVANLFSDSAGTVVKANPLTTDSDGRYWFYAADGSYIIDVASGSASLEVQLIDRADISAEIDDAVDGLKGELAATGGADLINFGTVGDTENATGSDVATAVNALIDGAVVLPSSPAGPTYLKTISDIRMGEPVTTAQFIPKNILDDIRNYQESDPVDDYFNEVSSYLGDGGIILMMNGRYELAATINLSSKMTLMGYAAGNEAAGLVTPCYFTNTNDDFVGDFYIDGSSSPGLRLAGFGIYGVSSSRGIDGINLANSNYIHLERINLTKLNTALKGTGGTKYFGSCTIQTVKVSQSVTGVDCAIDARLTNMHVIDCSGIGYNFSSGANDLQIIGCKSDFNARGFNFFNASNWSLMGCNIDRNGDFGIRVSGGENFTIGPNTYRRNGRLSVSPTQSAHIKIEGNASDFSICGGSTRIGANDDNTGLTTPTTGIILGDCSDGTISAVNLTGVTGSALLRESGKVQNNVTITACQPISINDQYVTSAASAVAGVGASLNNAETVNLLLKVKPVINNSGDAYIIKMMCRNNETNIVDFAESSITIRRGSGNAAVTMGIITNIQGDYFTTDTSISVTTNTDGSELTFSVTNNNASRHFIKFTLL